MRDNKPSSFRTSAVQSEAQKRRSEAKVLQLDEGQVRDAYGRHPSNTMSRSPAATTDPVFTSTSFTFASRGE